MHSTFITLLPFIHCRPQRKPARASHGSSDLHPLPVPVLPVPLRVLPHQVGPCRPGQGQTGAGPPAGSRRRWPSDVINESRRQCPAVAADTPQRELRSSIPAQMSGRRHLPRLTAFVSYDVTSGLENPPVCGWPLTGCRCRVQTHQLGSSSTNWAGQITIPPRFR